MQNYHEILAVYLTFDVQHHQQSTGPVWIVPSSRGDEQKALLRRGTVVSISLDLSSG